MELKPQSAPLNAAQIVVLVLLGLAAGSAYLTRHCIAVANTAIQTELSISDEQMGWVLGAFAAGYFLFQIPGGWLGNRIGTRSAFATISALWSAFTVVSSLAGSWTVLAASRVAFGAAQAGLVPVSAKVINDWFHENRRGICSAVVAASMSIGGVVAMKLTAELIDDYHWRAVFRMYSLVGIVWAAAFFAFFRTRPQDHPWWRTSGDFASGDGASQSLEVTASVPDTIDNPEPRQEVIHRFLTNRTVLAINIQSALRAAGYWLFVSWFPAFLEYRFELPAAQAGELAAWPLAGVVAGSLLGGRCVDFVLNRTNSKRASRSGVAGISLVACCLLTLAASWSPNANGFVLLMSMGALFSGAASPSAWAATMDVSGKHTAVVMGMMNMSGTVGAFIMPVALGYLIGDIRQSGGDWNLVVYLVAAIYLAAAICWLAVDPDDTP